MQTFLVDSLSGYNEPTFICVQFIVRFTIKDT